MSWVLKDEGEGEGRNAFQAGAMIGSLEELGLGRKLGGLCTWETSALVVQLVKNLPAMQESWVRWEDPLEEEMATHSSTPLPGEFHEQRSWAGYSPWDCRVRHNCMTNFHFHLHVGGGVL